MRPIAEQGPVSFVDGYPFLLISESSLADLNTRLPEPVSMQRFRPNIVLSGTAPYAEDSWSLIRIGTCIFEVMEACKRCTLTTINPDTTAIGKEPLETLATYRKDSDGDVVFGQYAIQRQHGTINVGDIVEILEMKDR